jgi:hypothetical protein
MPRLDRPTVMPRLDRGIQFEATTPRALDPAIKSRGDGAGGRGVTGPGVAG